MPVYPISAPPTSSSPINMQVGDTLQLSVTSQCKLCCTNPGLFSPMLPNGELLNVGFSQNYQATGTGTAQVSTAAANSNCGQIRENITRSVHISAGRPEPPAHE